MTYTHTHTRARNCLRVAGYSVETCSRSMNYLLYKQASALMPFPCKQRRLLNTTADGYIYKLLKTKADIVINYDEDAFLCDSQALIALVEYVIKNDIACAGMPDGGIGCRGHNPLVINPCFCVFNLRVIRPLFSKKKVKLFNYQECKERLQSTYPTTVLQGRNYNFEDIDFEPYYPFFLWLAANAKIYYLQTQQHADGLSTTFLNHENTPFLIHTWYSRDYGMDTYHTDRINNVIAEAVKLQQIPSADIQLTKADYQQYKLEQRRFAQFQRLKRFCSIPYRAVRKLIRFLNMHD